MGDQFDVRLTDEELLAEIELVTDMIDIGQEFRNSCTAETLETELLEGDLYDAYDDLMEQDLSFVHLEQEEIDRKVEWLLD